MHFDSDPCGQGLTQISIEWALIYVKGAAEFYLFL